MVKFTDLKIRHKLRIFSLFSYLSLILLGVVSNFFYNTGKTLSLVINAERIHNLTFQQGVEDYYLYRLNQNDTLLNEAISKMQEANEMAYMFGITSQLAELPKEEFSEMLYDHYKVGYNHKRSNADLMAGRMKLLEIIKPEKMVKAQQVALEGHKLGERILNKIIADQKNAIGVEQTIRTDLMQMRIFYDEFASAINGLIEYTNRLLYAGIILIVLILILSIGLIAQLISNSISVPVRQMVRQFSIIAKGNLNTELTIDSKNEMGELANSFRSLQKGFREVINYTKKMADGDYSSQITPRSEEDEMSIALNKMADNLKSSHEKLSQDAWFKSGLNSINEKLDSNQTLEEIAKQAISFLMENLHSELGSIYFANQTHQHVKLLASSGGDVKKLPQRIKLNEGMIGQVAYSKKMRIVDDVPADLYTTFSATGSYHPKQLIVVPMVFNESLIGVLELSSLVRYTPIEFEFLKQATEIIAVKLNSSENRIQTMELLQKTQDQAGELQVQQEELRVANEELTEHTKVLTENEKKLQVQQEELRVANEELEERTRQLEIQKEDISEKNEQLVETHDMLENKAKELEQASQYKSEFLANMSHELRTPLNSLLILSNLLSTNKKGNLTDDQIQSAKIIHKSGSDLLHLINEILDLSKIESGKMSLEINKVSATDLKDEIVMNFKATAEDKGVAFDVSIDPAFPKQFTTDRYRLMQIIKNLLSNAFKFTDTGKVTVSCIPTPPETIIRTEGLEPSSTCCIQISDTGVGIPQEKLESIFEAFQQADGSISRKFGGTGLGLSISRELVKMLGGEIQLESQVNKGSTFTIYLPVVLADGNKPDAKKPAPTQSEPITPETTNDENNSPEVPEVLPVYLDDDRDDSEGEKSVLIIHPSKEQAQLLLKQARDKKFKVIVAPDILQGISLAERYTPSSIMLAAKLATPKAPGYTKLKTHKRLSKLPVHVITPIEFDDSDEQMELKTIETIKFSDALESLENDFDGTHKKLLIIEDNRGTREVIKALLHDFQLNIREAGTAEEAYQLLANESFDFMILDLGLPDYSGKELLQKLQTNHISIPKVIVYTGKEMNKQDLDELKSYTDTIILKGMKSDERLMDEVTLFLHQVAMTIPAATLKPSLASEDSIFKGKKILVVDDDIRNVFALGQMLEEREIEVIEADNGQVALDMLNENQGVDLILMDVMMPVMDGYEAMRIIRQTPDVKDIPIICLTAKAMKEDHENALKNGANDYLSKPLNEEKLFSMLKIWLYKN
ncbi:response regulator [Sunxiuqinia indica]|uniref:response regulator n=1 Tax=Sunxiuqinia indica TaxID=2692584 RepID=UPI00135864D4|nr:response regulator [Sunxiuqinia indica]